MKSIYINFAAAAALVAFLGCNKSAESSPPSNSGSTNSTSPPASQSKSIPVTSSESGATTGKQTNQLTHMPDPISDAAKQKEPIFRAISPSDADFKNAYAEASRSLPRFLKRLQNGEDASFSAKLRFRDPDASDRLGKDQFVFIWLNNVHYHPDERLYSGTFFEVPGALSKWHRVGEQLGFEGEDIFDWMILTKDGRLSGGFTLRVTRSKLPESERAEYDRYIGAKVYEPEP